MASRHNSGNPDAMGFQDEEADDHMDVADNNEAVTMAIEDLDAQVNLYQFKLVFKGTAVSTLHLFFLSFCLSKHLSLLYLSESWLAAPC